MTQLKARETIYKGTKMRSRLEAGFAQWLDTWNFRWEYEPQCFASARGQYLPDFALDIKCLWSGDIKRFYVDVKPEPTTPAEVLSRMSIIWESEPSSELLVARPGKPNAMLLRTPTRTYPVDVVWAASGRVEDLMTLGLSIQAAERHGPWHGDWWKP